MALQTHGTQEYGDAVNRIVIDPITKTVTYYGSAQLNIDVSKLNVTGGGVNSSTLIQAQALSAAQFGAL